MVLALIFLDGARGNRDVGCVCGRERLGLGSGQSKDLVQSFDLLRLLPGFLLGLELLIFLLGLLNLVLEDLCVQGELQHLGLLRVYLGYDLLLALVNRTAVTVKYFFKICNWFTVPSIDQGRCLGTNSRETY